MTTTKKEKKICWLSIYFLADRALIPTTVLRDIGAYRDAEPVREVDYRNRDTLISALQESFAVGNPKLDMLPEEQKTRTPMEIRAKAKSWTDLERKSIYCSIKFFPSEFSIKCWGRAPNGTWSAEEDPALDIQIPVEQGIETVADTILDHLKTRRDLPGLMSASA